MDTRDIRARFVSFFEERGHDRVPSSSLVPNDPTLLLTNAGMNQFKPYFLGEQTPPFDRAVTVQKCMRAGGKHNDIDQVGKTARHLTFFEMLGNFSFGEYYKPDACKWAWELATEGYGLEAERLWATVFETDDEAFGAAADDGPAGNEDRYVEIWNLVFMQNDCNAEIEPIAELPKKNIDTGGGLERFAMVIQEKPTVFETDLLRSLIARSEELTGKAYGRDEKADIGLRILADHARSVSFMLADGILPSNEERGYVLRLIMRRAIRQARLLGREQPVLDPLIAATVDLMGDSYSELV